MFADSSPVDAPSPAGAALSPARASEAAARALQAAVLVLVPHLHGHRSGAVQSAPRQGDLRLDHQTLPVLPERAARLEEQCATQFVLKQMLS